MILPCEISQLDIQDVGRNHINTFFLVPVHKIITVQEIYSDSLFIAAFLAYIIEWLEVPKKLHFPSVHALLIGKE